MIRKLKSRWSDLRASTKSAIKTAGIVFMIGSVGVAGLPPTTMKALLDTAAAVTFNFQTPRKQATRINATTALIETGSNNVMANPGAEGSTPLPTAYADSGASPTDGTGGSPSITCARSTSSPITDGASFLITKGSSNLQGNGCTWDFTISKAEMGQSIGVYFDTELASGTYSLGNDTTDSDLTVWVYGPTDGTPTLQQVEGVSGGNRKGNLLLTSIGTTSAFQGRFNTAASGTAYRLILHESLTGTSAFSVKTDNIRVTKGVVTASSPGGSYLGTLRTTGTTGCTWSTSSTGFFSADSDCPTATPNSVATAVGQIAAPTTKIPGVRFPNGMKRGTYVFTTRGTHRCDRASTNCSSIVQFYDGTTASNPSEYGGVFAGSAAEFYIPSISGRITYDSPVTSDTTVQLNVTSTGGGNVKVDASTSSRDFEIDVFYYPPVESNPVTTTSQFNLSSYLGSGVGTRVTSFSTPCKLGEYISRLRNANADTFTDTNGAPTTSPNATDGIKIYNGNAYTSADTNNEPTFMQFCIGPNKQYRTQWWASTGHSGNISVKPFSSASDYGYRDDQYNSSTGILTVQAHRHNSGSTVHVSGKGDASADVNDPFFDVTISDSVIPVQENPKVYWSGFHGSNCAWTSTATSIGDPSSGNDGSCTFTERENSNFGTVTTAGSSLPGIVFTPPKAKGYRVCANFLGSNDTSTKYSYFALVDTTNSKTISTAVSRYPDFTSRPMCGPWTAPTTSSTTIKIQMYTDSSGTADISAPGTANTIEWSIEEI